MSAKTVVLTLAGLAVLVLVLHFGFGGETTARSTDPMAQQLHQQAKTLRAIGTRYLDAAH